MNKKKYYLGKEYITNEGYKVKVIKYDGYANVYIQFERGHIIKTQIGTLERGNIKNPFHPATQGVGYIGIGKYKAYENGKDTRSFSIWSSMFARCYNENYHIKKPTYIGCTVAEEWHNFQNFAEWYESNYHSSMLNNYHLDKDILVKTNKVYSSKYCCFIPKEINMMLTKSDKVRGKYPIGVNKHGNRYRAGISVNKKVYHLGLFDTPEEAFQAYKTAKEKHIKEVANKYRGQITEECYWALMNYQVEITD